MNGMSSSAVDPVGPPRSRGDSDHHGHTVAWQLTRRDARGTSPPETTMRPRILIVAALLALPWLGPAGCASTQPTAPPSKATTTRPRTTPPQAPPSTLGPTGPSAKDATRTAADSCLHISRHQYEVCVAYVANASYLARLPFYKFAYSPNADLARASRQRLESRYSGTARAQIERQTATWPAPGELDVYLPSIRIDAVRVAADLSTATLTTHETWLVRTQHGATLFSERNARHTITLARVPGVVLHKWVVTAIR
jgi:hypothetical protein